eukprot:scaffold651516_cov34-Prasinocladus_malaysianus.AAC.1
MEHSPTDCCRTRKQSSHQLMQGMTDHNAAVYIDPSLLAPVSVRGRRCMSHHQVYPYMSATVSVSVSVSPGDRGSDVVTRCSTASPIKATH